MRAAAESRGALWHGRLLVAAAASVPLGEGLALGALGCLALATAWRWRAICGRRLHGLPLGAALAGWGVWLACGLLALALGTEGWLRPAELGRWLPLLALPTVAAAAAALPRAVAGAAGTAFVGAAVAGAGWGLAQFGFDLHLQGLWARGEPANATQALLPHAAAHSVAGGFFWHRLKQAHVLLVALVVLHARQWALALSWGRRVLEALALMALLAALVLTYARAAVIALAAAALAQAWALWPGRRRLLPVLGGALGLLGLVAALGPGVGVRLRSTGGGEDRAARGLVWGQAAAVVADHPLGVGLGNCPTVLGRYLDSEAPEFDVHAYPHHMGLAALVEAGPVGLVAFFYGWAALVWPCVRRLRRGPEVAAAAGLGGGVALLVLGCSHDVLFHPPVALAFVGLFALVLAAWMPPLRGRAGPCA